MLIISNDARRSFGLGRSGIPSQVDSASNNRSAEGTWPHIRAHVSRSLGMGSVRDLIAMRKYN